MPLFPQKEQRIRRGPSDLVAVDLATTGTKVVRIKKSKDIINLLGIDILPPLALKRSGEETDQELQLSLPKNLAANYAALTVSGESAIVRYLSMSGHVEQTQAMESQVREHAGLSNEYRLAYIVTTHATAHPRGKAETKVLVVALPEPNVQTIVNLVSTGIPAPISIEVSGVAALTAFLNGPGSGLTQEAVGVLEAGARISFLALFNKGNLALVRKFEFGGDALIAKIQQQLGVDREIAQRVMSDGSFDISQSVHEVMDPFLRQLSISRDYVERREDCRIKSLYLSGGMSLCRCWSDEIRNSSGMQVHTWDPFEKMTVMTGAVPEHLKGQNVRFTAAVGAALGACQAS